MYKFNRKYVYISMLLVLTAFIIASCGGSGTSYDPAPVPTVYTPDYTGNYTGSVDGYVYKTSDAVDTIVLTENSRTDLQEAINEQVTKDTGYDDDLAEILTWLTGLIPQNSASVYVGTGEGYYPTDENGYFIIPEVDFENIYDPVGFGVEILGDDGYYGFQDYFTGDIYSLDTDTALKAVPSEIVTKKNRNNVFWIVSLDGQSLQNMNLSTTLGKVKGPFFCRKGGQVNYTKAYGFFKSHTEGDGAITATNGSNSINIPVQVVSGTATITGTVTHDGVVPDFGWVESYGPWAFDFIDSTDNQYTLKKVFTGTNRDVTACYFIWNDAKLDFDYYEVTQTVDLTGNLTLNFGGGTTPDPTNTPTTGPTPTNTPEPTPVWNVTNLVSSGVLPSAFYSDVYAIGNEVWITSGSSNQLFYNNAGGTTTFTTYSTPDEFLCIHMINSSTGYAGAQNGNVYRTSDGGANWTLLFPLIGTAINDITFPPTGNEPGYCCGEEGKISSITSSSTSSMSSLTSALTSITFPVSSSEGWVCGTDIVYHYNGSSWVGQGGPSGTLDGIYFVDNNNGWIVGSDGYGNGQICHTTNGGDNWSLQTDPSPSSGLLFKVFFINTQEGWAAGQSGRVIYTSDGGNNWSNVTTGTTALLRGIHFTASNNGYIVGNSGNAIKITN